MSLKRAALLAAALGFGLCLYAQTAAVDGVIDNINAAMVANPASPRLPDFDQLSASDIFDKGADEDYQFYTQDKLVKLFSVYASYAKFLATYENEFVYLHVNALKYLSGFCAYFSDNTSTDMAQLLGGLSQVLVGSLQIMCADAELNDKHRASIAQATREVVALWWTHLTTPMQTQIFMEARKFVDAEKNETVQAALRDIIARYGKSLL